MSWTARLAECPACRRGIAVRPFTGRFFRHGQQVCCPGSDRTVIETSQALQPGSYTPFPGGAP